MKEERLNNWKEQLSGDNWRGLLFSIFNFRESEGFLTELKALTKKTYYMEDFVYMKLKVDDTVKNGIKNSDEEVMGDVKEFKKTIEGLNPKARVYPIKESGSLIVVKTENSSINL